MLAVLYFLQSFCRAHLNPKISGYATRSKDSENLIPGLNTRSHFSENIACDLKMYAPWEVILVKVLPAVEFHNREFVQSLNKILS